jgi:hypothetical protein
VRKQEQEMELCTQPKREVNCKWNFQKQMEMKVKL